MHTIEHDGVRVHFNADLSGDVLIHRDGRRDDYIPGELLLKLFREWINSQIARAVGE